VRGSAGCLEQDCLCQVPAPASAPATDRPTHPYPKPSPPPPQPWPPAGQLLDHIGGNVNPLVVIQKLPCGMEVPRLRDRLRAIISDFRTQTCLREGCNAVLAADCRHLISRLRREARRALGHVYVHLGPGEGGRGGLPAGPPGGGWVRYAPGSGRPGAAVGGGEVPDVGGGGAAAVAAARPTGGGGGGGGAAEGGGIAIGVPCRVADGAAGDGDGGGGSGGPPAPAAAARRVSKLASGRGGGGAAAAAQQLPSLVAHL
jgi:hypothetical protein